MTRDALIGAVQERAPLDDRDAASEITEAVLETFGEVLYRTERDQISAQLPEAFAHSLQAARPENTRQDAERPRAEEFLNRVQARADVGYPDAKALTPVVLEVLSDALGEGTLDDIARRLPESYAELFPFVDLPTPDGPDAV